MKKYLKSIAVFTITLGVLTLTSCRLVKEDIFQTINASDTTFAYHLLDDNVNPQVTYPKYEKFEFDNGYDYYTLDGSEVHRFTQIDKYGDKPVMSYMRINDNGNMHHQLFSIKLGSPTKVYQNKVLGVKKSSSLVDYLFALGFKRNFDKEYINVSNAGMSENSYNWVYLIKDEVFLNIAVGSGETNPLLAFEMGINVPEVISKLVSEKNGLSFRVNEGSHYLFNQEVLAHDIYQSGSLISLKLKKDEGEIIPSLYFNDKYIKDFSSAPSDLRYNYETMFFMPSFAVEINISFSK